MITVADVLELDILSSATLVAGASGICHPVRWMHVVEEPDVTRWVRGGEILLTTGKHLAQDLSLQRSIIPDLAKIDLAGMFVATGRYLEQVPQVMLESGEAHQFPIVEVPWDIRFVDIMQTVHELIINRHYALLGKSVNIHNTLTQIVLNGGGLQEVAKALAKLTDHPITIESPDFELLAHASVGELDVARRTTIAAGRSSPDLIRALRSKGVFETMLREQRAVHVPALPAHGMTLDRIVAPIIVGGELYGYVWLIADKQPLGELEMLAIEHGATVTALIMLHEQDLIETENRLRGDSLARLLDGQSASLAKWTTLADQCQLDTRHRHRVIVADMSMPDQPLLASRILRRAEECARQIGPHIFTGWLGDYLIIITEIPDGVDLSRSFGLTLISEWPGLHIGIGGAREELTALSESYEEAVEALTIGQALPGRDLTCIDDLGFLHWLYHVPEGHRSRNLYLVKLAKLIEYDRGHGGELLNTLEAYLDTNGNAVLAAQNLFVHRNTLFYRLGRSEEICDIDLSDPLARLNLHVALKGYRLYHNALPKET